MTEAKITAEVMVRFLKKGKHNLIEKIVENLKNEGRGFLIKEIVDYLRIKKEEMTNKKPAKLFLAFDHDSEKIEKYVKDNFGLEVKVIKKILEPELILGGKLLTENFLIDFSLKNLLVKFLKWKT